MAPRNKEQLLESYKTTFGSDFDMTPFNALRAVVGDKATEAALLARLRELLPTQSDTPDVDWVAQFMGKGNNADLIANLRRIVNQVAEALAAERKEGSQMSIDIDLLASADNQVALNNKQRKARTTINRVYDQAIEQNSLGRLLKDNDVYEMFVSFGKGEDKTAYSFRVKYGKPIPVSADNKLGNSGCQFMHDGKWSSIGALNEVVKTLAKKHTDKGAINTWANVKVKIEDTTRTIGDLYDETYFAPDAGE